MSPPSGTVREECNNLVAEDVWRPIKSEDREVEWEVYASKHVRLSFTGTIIELTSS